METMNSIEFNYKDVTVMEWKSVFFPDVKYVGYIEDIYGRNGRRLMSLGRTEQEAHQLSMNKQGGSGIWRVADAIKNEKLS